MPSEPRARPSGLATGDPIRDSALGRVTGTVEEVVAFNAAVWRASKAPPALLEIVRLRNARTVDCVYCKAVRYDVARADGLSEARAAMVADSYRQSALAPREKAAVALADAYLGFPAGVGGDLANEVVGAFSREEVAALMVALMNFNFTSRTAVALGGMPEDPLPVIEISPPTLAP